MARQELHLEARIDAAPEAVWKVLTDPKRFKDWMAGFKSTDAKSLGKGKRFVLTTAVGKQELESHVEVTGWDPPKALAWDHREDLLGGKPFDMARDTRSEFRLEPDGDATRIEVTFGFEPQGFKAKLGAGMFLQSSVRPEMEKSLQRLGRLVK